MEVATRQDEILTAFEVFHVANTAIFRLFERFAFEIIGAGREHYSARAVVHRIRWHVAIKTTGEEVKINDHYSPYYGRLFELRHPQHEGFFRKRRCPSSEAPATGKPIMGHTGAPEDGQEEAVNERLIRLLPNQNPFLPGS